LKVLRSDLNENRLGIEPSQYEQLCKTVDAVVHSRPMSNIMGYTKSSLKDNVVGTENVLEFALAGKNRISTLYLDTEYGSGDIPGKEYLVFNRVTAMTRARNDHLYIKSKFEAEKRVLAYRARGLNASIYRREI